MRKVVLELTAIDDIYFFGKNDLKLLKKFLNLFCYIQRCVRRNWQTGSIKRKFKRLLES